MTQIEKLYAQLVANCTSMQFRDFRRILEAFDFTLERISGDCHIFKLPAVSRDISAQSQVVNMSGRIEPRKLQILGKRP